MVYFDFLNDIRIFKQKNRHDVGQTKQAISLRKEIWLGYFKNCMVCSSQVLVKYEWNSLEAGSDQ